MKSITSKLNEELNEGMRAYNRNPLNEEELFALGSFFMEFGEEKAIKWFEKEYQNDLVTDSLRSAIEKLQNVGDGLD